MRNIFKKIKFKVVCKSSVVEHEDTDVTVEEAIEI